jgi:hypothetical protein
MEMEAREKAAQMRINNFYRSDTGNINPETFTASKKNMQAEKSLPSK